MNWLKSILTNNKSVDINSYSDFWNWFSENESRFYKTIQSQNNIEKNFFNHLSPALNQLNEGFFFLAGMFDDNTAELIITADGDFKVIPYVEDLIEACPKLMNWKFTAHKAPSEPTISIDMGGHKFNDSTLSFYVNEHKECPDEIDIAIVYKNFNDEESDMITNGVFIYLDNYIGEIQSISTIDKVTVVGPDQGQDELIAIEKLQDYLTWREKEFIEKYNGVRHNTEEDSYASLEATTNEGLPIVAIMNTTLLEWDRKASHPWMICLDINYDGSSKNGMPNDKTYKAMYMLESEILSHLKDSEGYLNLGRETGNNIRTIFLACRDFRIPVKTIDKLKTQFSELDITFEIFKDKYWVSLNRYIKVVN